MVPFIRTTPYNMKLFNELIDTCDGIYSNRGKNEQKLVSKLEDIIGYPVATATNATVALDLARKLYNVSTWHLPSFTFPATNLGVKNFKYIEPELNGSRIGFTKQSKERQIENYGQIITIPFGNFTKNNSVKCDILTIIDAAAGASPDMHLVKEWLANNADIVVVSLHATKIWPAGEGAFVVFKDINKRDEFVKKSNFGIEIFNEIRFCEDTDANNIKMSEFNACAALASFDNFISEYKRRQDIVMNLIDISQANNIPFIPSIQTFWIAPKKPWQITTNIFAKTNVHVRNYYWYTKVTPHIELSSIGICIPTHDEKIIEIYKQIVKDLCD